MGVVVLDDGLRLSYAGWCVVGSRGSQSLRKYMWRRYDTGVESWSHWNDNDVWYRCMLCGGLFFDETIPGEWGIPYRSLLTRIGGIDCCHGCAKILEPALARYHNLFFDDRGWWSHHTDICREYQITADEYTPPEGLITDSKIVNHNNRPTTA